MGNSYGTLQAPPGGELVWLQRPSTCETTPQFHAETQPLPRVVAALQNPNAEAAWREFASRLAPLVAKFRNRQQGLGICIGLYFIFLMLFILRVGEDIYFVWMGVSLVFLMLGFWSVQIITNKNLQVDREIQSLVFQNVNVLPGIAMSYMTMYTNCCKPKYARPQRAVCLASMIPRYNITIPAGAPPGSVIQVNCGGQILSVTVPPGAVPGQQIEVTTAPAQNFSSGVAQTAVAMPVAAGNQPDAYGTSAAGQPKVPDVPAQEQVPVATATVVPAKTV